jgi:DNA invertase Pin-like site-specific DNA recombinase
MKPVLAAALHDVLPEKIVMRSRKVHFGIFMNGMMRQQDALEAIIQEAPSPEGILHRLSGMKYGYARVSTDDQNPTLQLAALKKAGCRQTFTDHGLSGATTKRSTLARCLKALEHGDTVTVWKLDRLGRSVRDMLHMVALLAELERGLITERTCAGVKAAKRRGVKFGCKPKPSPEQVDHAREQKEGDRA